MNTFVRPIRRVTLLGALVVVSLSTLPAPGVAAAPTWAPAATASVHPGVQTFTAGAQCNTN